MLKIDTHAHWYPRQWVELLASEGGKNNATIGKNERGQVTFAVPGMKQNFQATYIELGLRLKMMDDARVDIHALSLTSPMVYWAPPEFGPASAGVDDARRPLKHPNRFIGMAMVLMQAPELAVQEVERAAKPPGIRGVYMATHGNGKNLEDKSLRWYQRCEALELRIFCIRSIRSAPNACRATICATSRQSL
jgi:aminocarboxymuconate-semialdehyde decarboxylase